MFKLLLYLISTLITIVICWLVFFIHQYVNYFRNRGVLYERPDLIYGNGVGVGYSRHLYVPLRYLYEKYKNRAPLIGFYLSYRKFFLILDLDLVKRILISDFNQFINRGIYYNEKDDPLSAHLFNIEGKKWKILRSKLTPTFSAGKMKFMFSTVVEVANRCVKVLETISNDDNNQQNRDGIEIKEILSRFTTDVIGSCAFGLEVNSLTEPNLTFREMCKKLLARRHKPLIFNAIQAFPNICRALGVRLIRKELSELFMQVVKDTVAYRETEQIQRNDFMSLLIDMKNEGQVNIEEIAAQSLIFILAGFETSSLTMAFALYELALNADIQDKARREVLTVLQKYDNQLTYEAMLELDYLKQITYETMRKYPVATVLQRRVICNYKVPNTEVVIEKNAKVAIPVNAIHYDPDLYPEPQRFQPERFTAEAISQRHSMSWLPFGDGPRNCIGLRFGKMQMLIGLAILLSNFRFTLHPKTPIPLVIDPKISILTPKDGVYLKLIKI